jgi:hypothetical protein
MKYIKYSIFVIIFLQIFVAIPNINTARAETATSKSYTLLEPIPCIESKNVTCKNGSGSLMTEVPDFDNYTQYIFNLVYGLSAVAAIFMIVLSGFKYVTVESFTGKSDAKKNLQNAILGLLLLFGSYLILRTINPRLVEIPIGLVPKLQITYDKNSVKNFFDALVLEIEKNDKKIEQRIKDINSLNQETKILQTIVDGLTKKLDELKSKGVQETDSQYRELLRQISGIKDDINRNKGDAIVISSRAKMESAVSGIQKGMIATSFSQMENDITNGENAIDSIAQQETNKLDSLGRAELKTEIDYQARYEKARLNLTYVKAFLNDLKVGISGAGFDGKTVSNGIYYTGNDQRGGIVGNASVVRDLIESKFQAIELSMADVKDSEMYDDIVKQISETESVLKTKIKE